VIDYTTVSREFQSLVARRRELMTLLGSVFAGLGLFLQNALQGNLPPALAALERHLFASVALVLLVASLILSLRMARLHGGMVLNGVLHARLLQDQDFTRKGDPDRAARPNHVGASFVQFALVTLIAGFSCAVLILALHLPRPVAAAGGAAVVVAWMLLYGRFHRGAVALARRRIAAEPAGPVRREEWEAHTSESLANTNDDLLSCLSFTGLIMFSAMEMISGLGQVRLRQGADLRAEDIVAGGPALYTGLMLLTCLLQLVAYVRLRVALGRFSLELDPTDRPFRPFRLTDSYLGYVLLVFLTGVSTHLFALAAVPALRANLALVLALDAAVVTVALLAEPITLAAVGRGYYHAAAAELARREASRSLADATTQVMPGSGG
jgi:hypothetical protein